MKRSSCKFTCVGGGGGLQEEGRACMPVKKVTQFGEKYFPSSSFTFPSPFRALNHKILIALTCQGLSDQEQKKYCQLPLALSQKNIGQLFPYFSGSKLLQNFFWPFLFLCWHFIFSTPLFFPAEKRGELRQLLFCSLFLREIRYFTWLHPLEKHKPSSVK